MLDQVSAVKGLMGGDAGYFIAVFKAHVGLLDWIFFHKKPKPLYKRVSLRKLPGVFHGNVVWEHFAKGKKQFSVIVKRFS